MKRLFILLAAAILAMSAMAQKSLISPTICGLTVGKTALIDSSKMARLDEQIQNEGKYQLVSFSQTDYVYYGDFIVEGLHMSLMHIELINDTIYRIEFKERSPYANCWEAYKDLAFKIRDKYAGLKNMGDVVSYENDSAVTIFKTDGKTQLLFAAYPDQLSYELIDQHLHNVYVNNLASEMYNYFSGKTGPNYDEKNKVTGVAGVKFGDTRETVRKVIYTKAESLLDSDAHSLKFYKVKVGGTTYDYAAFYFKEGKLVSVNLQQPFHSWRDEEALMMYNETKSTYSNRYSNYRDIKDETNEKSGVCGAYDENGYPPIYISFSKSLSKGGDIMYYIQVDYFPLNRDGLYDDEI